MLEMIDLLHQIKAWVAKVGQMQREALLNKNFDVMEKDSNINLVTEIDIKSEKILKDFIWKAYPEHAILGEEDNRWQVNYEVIDSDTEVDYQWVIDPIDGTTNFVHGHPFFCISIALKYKGVTQLGVVYMPMYEQMYEAILGQGARLNGRKIQVSETKTLSNALLATGFPYSRAKENMNLPYFNGIINKIAGIRRSGSAAIDLCFVAAGMVDGYWEFCINEWDICAGLLIISEAGGVHEVVKRHDGLMVKAGNDVMLKILKDYLV